MKKDDGYTLAEVLVALFVIGLTTAGLAAGSLLLDRLQVATARTVGRGQGIRAIQARLDGLLDNQGPFLSPHGPNFEGAADGFRFDCAAASLGCGARVARTAGGLALQILEPGKVHALALEGARSAQFSYVGSRTVGPAWPVEGESQPLRAISLMAVTATGTDAVASSRIWIEQPMRCEFDPIIKACRE